MAKKGKPAEDAKTALAELPAPSPNPMTNLIIADLALRAGSALLRRGVEKGLLAQKLGAAKAGKAIKGRSMVQTLVGTALVRVATRSVPGAIVVGGGLLAKTLYDRKHAKAAKADGTRALEQQVKRGEKA